MMRIWILICLVFLWLMAHGCANVPQRAVTYTPKPRQQQIQKPTAQDTEARVKRLLVKLGDESFNKRESAQAEFEKMLSSAQAGDVLVHLRQASQAIQDPEVRRRLGHILAPHNRWKVTPAILQAVPNILDLIDSSSPGDMEGITKALKKVSKKEAEAFLLNAKVELNLDALGSTESVERWRAAENLGKLGDKRAVMPLIHILSDKKPGAGQKAIFALGEIGDRRAVPLLLDMLKNAEWPDKIEAAYALGKIAGPKVVMPLIESLKDPYLCGGASVDALAAIGKPATDALIPALDDENVLVRWGAALALGKIGDDRALEPIINLLADHSDLCRGGAVNALAAFKDKRAIKALIRALKDENWNCRYQAAWILGKKREREAINPLIEALKDKSALVSFSNYREEIPVVPEWYAPGFICYARDAYVGALVTICKDDRGPLVKALRDKNASVRAGAAEALAGMGDKQGFTQLIEALKHESGVVRHNAVELLGKFADKRAFKPLVEILGDKEDRVRRAVVIAIGKTGKGKEIVAPLLPVLADKDRDVREEAAKLLLAAGDRRIALNLLGHVNPDVRILAAEILAKLGDETAGKPLMALLTDKNYRVRVKVIEALGSIGFKDAAELLVKLLKDEEDDIRSAAAFALGSIGDKRAVPVLIKMLKSKRNTRRVSIIFALHKLGDSRAVGPLIEAFKESNSWTKCLIREALKDLTNQDFGYSYDKWKQWHDKSGNK